MKAFYSFTLILLSVSISIGQATSIYCDFETECEVLAIDTVLSENLWQVGHTDKPNFQMIGEGKKMMTDTASKYPVNNYSVFYTKFATMKWDFWINISFQHVIDSHYKYDGGYIEISTDQGVTWQNVIQSQFYVEWDSWEMYTEEDTLFNGTTGFSGNMISSFLDTYFTIETFEIDTLFLRFVFISDSIDNQREGWCLDNLRFIGWWEGIGENEEMECSVYPNPVTEKAILSFENPEKKVLTLEIFNYAGQKVYCLEGIKSSDTEIQKGDLAPGIYLFKLNDRNSTLCSGRFVVK